MFTLNCNGRLLVINKPVVMGILNITPDSFYKQSRLQTIENALQQAEAMLNEGATMLDIGGQSTRPRSERITAAEEAESVLPVIESVSKNFPDAFISVDTYHAYVAEQAINAGACIVNDISGGTMDANMLSTVGKLSVPYVCMHIKAHLKQCRKIPYMKMLHAMYLIFLFIKQNNAG